MNKATVLKSVTAVVGAGVAAYCGQLAAPVLVLLCMMVIDYVTGMVKAYMTGIDLHIKLFCGLLVAIWLIINELISILENLAAIGVPGFPRLSKLLERLKNTVSKGDNADEK